MRKILGTVIFIIILMPIVFVYLLSTKEMESYNDYENYNFTEKAIGDVYITKRRDIKEYYKVSGEVVSGKSEIIELSEVYNYLYVQLGEEVKKNQIIGYDNTGRNIMSPCNGVISEIDFDNKYIRIDSFEDILLKCAADKNTCKSIQDEKKLLISKKEIEIDKISDVCKEGFQDIYFKVNNDTYMVGEKYTKLKIYTGRTYKDVLTIESECVYQKEDGLYYVRVVNEKGEFLTEQQVQVGYSSDKYICITGVDENTYCDSGYKMLMEVEE